MNDTMQQWVQDDSEKQFREEVKSKLVQLEAQYQVLDDELKKLESAAISTLESPFVSTVHSPNRAG